MITGVDDQRVRTVSEELGMSRHTDLATAVHYLLFSFVSWDGRKASAMVRLALTSPRAVITTDGR
jgi:hypothetical protein